MEKLLEALGLSSVLTVGISVSASNIIEMICVDKTQRTITKYACRELKYNNAIREIISYDDFTTVVQELFQELNINPKGCNVILNLPNVHFGFTSVPMVLPIDQISTAIVSEVEEMYLFKRHEPVVSWNTISEDAEAEKRTVVYTAIQENTLQNIKDIFDQLGAKLIVIETANSSMIKGLVYSNILEEEFESDETIDILLISSNSYSIFSMQGKKILDYYEEPLAIKSFSNDEVYVAISSAAGTALENYPAKHLLVVSETNEVSAEILCHKMNFEGNIKFLDRNIYTEKSFMEVSSDILAKYLPVISLEAVGTAVYSFETFPIKFNFLQTSDVEISDKITIAAFGKEYEINKKSLLNISLIVAVAVLCFFLFIGLMISLFEKRKVKEISMMADEFVTITTQIKATETTGNISSIYTITKQISDENTKEVAIFYGLGTEIPNDVYLTNFSSNSLGEVTIEGNASSSESIYSYVKGLKTKYPDIKISRLQMEENLEAGAVPLYSFLIESEAASRKAAEMAAQEENKEKEGNNNQEGPKAWFQIRPLAPAAPAAPTAPEAPAAPAAPAAAPATPSAPAANAPGALPAPVAP